MPLPLIDLVEVDKLDVLNPLYSIWYRQRSGGLRKVVANITGVHSHLRGEGTYVFIYLRIKLGLLPYHLV